MNIKNEDKTRIFASGAVRGEAEGKGRFDLIPPEALFRVAKRYEFGAKKYGDETWKKGIPKYSLLDSAFRHLMQFSLGLTDEDHLSAVVWNIFALMYAEEHKEE